MKIGLVSTWCEKGASYLTRAYADFLKKHGHEVFIYARGGNIGYITSGEWVDNYDVEFQKLTIHEILSDLETNIPNKLIPTAEDWALFNKISIDRFPEQWCFTKLDMKQFRKWHKNTGVEVVFFNEQKEVDGVNYLKNNKVKTIYFGTDPTPLAPADYENYDHVIWHTECNKETMPCNNGSLVLWGIDTTSAKRMCKKDDPAAFFFNAGTDFLNGRKGHDWLIKIWDHIVTNNKDKNLRLTIHSIFNIDRLDNELKQILDSIPDKLHLVVGKKGFPGFYGLGNVYLYPARKDGIGLTLLEAMYCGMPLIVPNSKPFCEYVKDGITGTLLHKTKDNMNIPWSPVHEIDVIETMEACLNYIDTPGLVFKQAKSTIDLLKEKFDFNKNHKILLEIL